MTRTEFVHIRVELPSPPPLWLVPTFEREWRQALAGAAQAALEGADRCVIVDSCAVESDVWLTAKILHPLGESELDGLAQALMTSLSGFAEAHAPGHRGVRVIYTYLGPSGRQRTWETAAA